jgi:hypothetical protein
MLGIDPRLLARDRADLLFALTFRVLPSSGYVRLGHPVRAWTSLPSIALAAGFAAADPGHAGGDARRPARTTSASSAREIPEARSSFGTRCAPRPARS